MARRTREEALETRHAILDAAEREFHLNGVANTSLADVALSAGVTRGAIYWHFKDKADLFDAMMQRVVLPVELLLDRAGSDPKADPLALLKLCMTEVLLRTARDAQVQRVFEIAYYKCEYTGDASGVRERHVASQGDCTKIIEKAFRACVAKGALPATVNPKEAAFGALSFISGIIANWVLDPKAISLERHAASLVDTYFRGLAAKPARVHKRAA